MANRIPRIAHQHSARQADSGRVHLGAATVQARATKAYGRNTAVQWDQAAWAAAIIAKLHFRLPLLSGLSGAQSRGFAPAQLASSRDHVNVVERDRKSAPLRKLYQLARHIWRHCLAPLVERNVPLRDAEFRAYGGLGQAKALPKDFEIRHAPILAPLVLTVNSGAICG
jgi:hypothetical protein